MVKNKNKTITENKFPIIPEIKFSITAEIKFMSYTKSYEKKLLKGD